MNLSDIKPSITLLSDEESFDLIRRTRFLRRQRPEKKKSTKKPKSKGQTINIAKPKVTTKQAIKKMTKEQRLKLIAELKGMD